MAHAVALSCRVARKLLTRKIYELLKKNHHIRVQGGTYIPTKIILFSIALDIISTRHIINISDQLNVRSKIDFMHPFTSIVKNLTKIIPFGQEAV
jgi:hypothetical protein